MTITETAQARDMRVQRRAICRGCDKAPAATAATVERVAKIKIAFLVGALRDRKHGDLVTWQHVRVGARNRYRHTVSHALCIADSARTQDPGCPQPGTEARHGAALAAACRVYEFETRRQVGAILELQYDVGCRIGAKVRDRHPDLDR